HDGGDNGQPATFKAPVIPPRPVVRVF
ncbi:hypothetical protein LCGC14_3132580, partial [marine sediment metagenome]